MWSTGQRPKSRPGGFTLMEMLMVLLILGLFSSILIMRMENVFSGGDLRLASRIIIREIRKARGTAAQTHKEQILGLNMDKNLIYLLELPATGEGAFKLAAVQWDTLAAKPAYLPPGVKLEDVVIMSKGKMKGGEASIRFFANGCIDPSLIHIKNEKDDVYTLKINPVTGQVTLYDRYIEERIIQ